MPDSQPARQERSDYWDYIDTHDQWPAFDRVLFFTFGVKVTALVRALAELGVADLLKDGPREISDLASAIGADTRSLYRGIRAAASVGIFIELEDGRIALTPEAESLCGDAADGVRELMIFNGHPMLTRSYEQLAHALRTGESAFERAFGAPFYEYLETDPEAADVFEQSMLQRAAMSAPHLLPKANLSRFKRVIDLAGGRGFLIAETLKQYPEVTGALFERPGVLAKAKEVFERYGVSDRVELVEGDFFVEVPSGYDAYVIGSTLTNWNDEGTLKILRNVRKAIGDSGARLIILEKIVVEATDNKWDYGKFIDIDKLLLYGGREHTLSEWRELVSQAGFEIVSVSDNVGFSRWEALECVAR